MRPQDFPGLGIYFAWRRIDFIFLLELNDRIFGINTEFAIFFKIAISFV